MTNLSIQTGFPEFTAPRQSLARKPAIALPTLQEQSSQTLPERFAKTGTQIVTNSHEELEQGYRQLKTFTREDGRSFTKIEEFVLTDRGSRKTVIQQTPSGSVTRYEEVLDREDSGNFRRTQRFQDESGEVATTITPDYKVTDGFILTGAKSLLSYGASLFERSRGMQLDLAV